MSEYYTFDCGCKFKINSGSGPIPAIEFNPHIKDIRLDCPKTWGIIASGNTKGCFQLESRLGQSMAKKLKPSNVEELSALIAILRPGCLEAMREGKSVSNHYIDKKNGQESVDYFHPSLEHILSTTYGEMIYQEQSMQIAQEIAGFDLQEADILRKAIGKKKPEEMAKLKSKFIEGCSNIKIVSVSEAEEIFGWIEKSQRYSFNKSHSVSYAINAYLSAYAKAHFPKIFFASYLRFAKDKIDPKQEIKELVKNANQMDITIRVPDFRDMQSLFYLKDKQIYFGLTNIKGLGDSVFEKIKSLYQENKTIDYNVWLDVLFKFLPNINSIAAKNLLSSGAFDFLSMNRTEMIFQYELISILTDKEIEFIVKSLEPNDTIAKCIKKLLNKPKLTKKRLETINNMLTTLYDPPYSMVDKIEWLSDTEEALLGTAISCSRLDSYDIDMTNTDCKNFMHSGNTKNIIIAGEIDAVNIVKTKKGKNPGQEMAFVGISDQYGSIDSVVLFPDKYAEYKHHLFVNNVLVFVGNKNKTMDGFVVEKCFMPST